MKTLKHLISQVSLLNKSNLLQQARIKLTCLSGSPKNLHTMLDRKSTRLNSSHSQISYAVFCLKKKTYKQDSALPIRSLQHTPEPPSSSYLGRAQVLESCQESVRSLRTYANQRISVGRDTRLM